MNLVLLWFVCVFIFLFHEFGHFLSAVVCKKFGGFVISPLICGIDLKFPVPLGEWYAIMFSGVFAGVSLAVFFPTDFPLETIFLIYFAFTISILDLLLIYMVRREEKVNPFFKGLTSEDTLVIEFRKFRTGEARI